MLSVDEGRGQGEEGSPVQNQESCVCAGPTQKQMGSSCPLTKWGWDYYYNPDNVTVYITSLSLSTFPIACGPGLFSSKTSSGLMLSFQIFPHQLIH